MVRETRYLWVSNLPEKCSEEEITEHFKRYGKIQSVKLQTKQEGEKPETHATVAFMDITSAAKAHGGVNKIDDVTLRTSYHEPSAIRTREPEGGPAPAKDSPTQRGTSQARAIFSKYPEKGLTEDAAHDEE